MTNREASIWLCGIKEQFTGNCTTDTLVPISRCDIQAIDLAIEALVFTESQRACCDNCVNYTRKSKEVCTSPYGPCEFFEDKTQQDQET